MIKVESLVKSNTQAEGTAETYLKWEFFLKKKWSMFRILLAKGKHSATQEKNPPTQYL
jgi:hypothetical protein